MPLLLLLLGLLACPLATWAQPDSQRIHPDFHEGDTARHGGAMRGDSSRTQREFAMLADRLKLDSAQARYVGTVLNRRGQKMRDLRNDPIKDRSLMAVRIAKLFEDADRDIERKLAPAQKKEYGKIKQERQARFDGQRDRGRKRPGTRPGGGRRPRWGD